MQICPACSQRPKRGSGGVPDLRFSTLSSIACLLTVLFAFTGLSAISEVAVEPIFALQQSVTAVAQGAIEGVLKDQGGKPVVGALVAAVPDVPGASAGSEAAGMTRSGSDGRFRIEHLQPGPYALTATAPDLVAAYLAGLSLKSGETLGGVEVSFAKEGFTISGHLLNSARRPIANGQIRAERYSPLNGDIFYVVSDSQGNYSITLPTARYAMFGASEGLETARKEVAADSNRSLDLVLYTQGQKDNAGELQYLVRSAKSGKANDRSGLAAILSFETDQPGGTPGGWGGGPIGTIFADDKIVHSGRWAARLERRVGSPGKFSALIESVPINFAGESIELSGFLRTEDVSGATGLWMREYQDGHTDEQGNDDLLAFDDMQQRQVKGTTGWAEYSIVLPLDANATELDFGVFAAGTGTSWADDLQLRVDGKPIWDVPERPKATFNEFDGGSRIAIHELTKLQIENLATLGKVWGFLKYHHPDVTSGRLQWDYELFRVLPAVLAAPDRATGNTVLFRWVEGLSPVGACNPCAKLEESDLHLHPELGWIAADVRLGAKLSARLRWIYANRAIGKQFYVSTAPNVGNPHFEHELTYSHLKLPDAGFQILGLYRFWNIIEYWSPYRNGLGEDWDQVLVQFLPRIALAKDSDAYQRELLALIARAHDTHANLWSSLDVRPPTGACYLPVLIRFVENRAVVVDYSVSDSASTSGLKIGDIVTDLDGVPVAKLVEGWVPYYADSNDAARLRDIARSMTRGDCGDARVGIRRERKDIQLKVKRVPPPSSDLSAAWQHDLTGDSFRLISKDVAYLKLSSVKASEAAHYVEAAAGTKGLIIDIRNYPSEFVVFALGSLLVDKPTEFVRFTVGDLSNPGAFHWGPPLSLSPQKPQYAGKVVILIDEMTQSQAEYTSMAFRAAPGTIVVGSTTAGADGNVSPFGLPGGFRTMISGIGVFYPDKRPTQRVGIVPDVEIHPTIAGIRAGKDEVLEEALRQILGRETPAAQLEKMYRP